MNCISGDQLEQAAHSTPTSGIDRCTIAAQRFDIANELLTD